MCGHTYACACPHAPHVHSCTHTHTHACTHLHTDSPMHIHMHPCTHAHAHTPMHTCIHSCVHSHAHAHTYMHTGTFPCTHSHAHMHTYPPTTHMHTHVHTHIPQKVWPLPALSERVEVGAGLRTVRSQPGKRSGRPLFGLRSHSENPNNSEDSTSSLHLFSRLVGVLPSTPYSLPSRQGQS